MYLPLSAPRRLLTILLLACASVLVHATSVSFIATLDQPSQLIQASNGFLYGTAQNGGVSSSGYVFRLSTSGTATILHSFNGTSDGGTPTSSLIEGSDGNLYGTTTTGGIGNGTLFRMSLAGAITVLHNFSTSDGSQAGSLIQTSAGDLFGTANFAGSSGLGTVFEYSHLGVFSVFHTFSGTSGDGARPSPALVQASNGLIYGATLRGGSLSNGGSAFRFNPSVAGSLVTFGSFPPTDMSDPFYNPSFGMTQFTDGNLYGATAEGGTSGYGSIYRVVPGAPSLTTDYTNFNSSSTGGLPETSLTLAGNGNLYGTTSAYGLGGPPSGTIFSLNSSLGLTILYDFSAPHGAPTGAPIEASDGNFYGPAGSEIYKMTLSAPIPPPVHVTASPAAITLGSSSTIAWNVVNAISDTAKNCWAHGSWSGSKALSGSTTVTPSAAGTYTYALTCGGVVSGLATVTVSPSAGPTPTPVITPAAGTYTGPVTYNITDSASFTTIHYTTDGTTPTESSPIWPGSPLVLLSTTTVKAVAQGVNRPISAIASSTFTISATTSTACSVNYGSGFYSSTNLHLNHGATLSASDLVLTHNLTNEATSAFTKARIPLKTFATNFKFRFLNATSKSGDGITFALSAKSPTLYGTSGIGLGYARIPSSMGLKFDLVNNAGEGVNSVGLYFNGAVPDVPAFDLTPSGINLHSGHILDAYVSYESSSLVLNLTDTVTGAHYSHTFPLTVPSPIGASSAYAGFTGGSSSQISNAQILSWKLLSSGPCL